MRIRRCLGYYQRTKGYVSSASERKSVNCIAHLSKLTLLGAEDEVGLPVGALEGLAVGLFVGALEGDSVGPIDGA